MPRHLLLLCLTLPFHTACLFTPGHERVVCGADNNVYFSGYVTAPSTTITIEASTSASGPFTAIGTVTSASSPVTVTGEDYYSFADNFTIDEWSSSTSGLSVYIRAKAGSVTLLTFEEQNSAGQNGLSCVLDGIINGKTASVAALDCDRDDPVLRVDAPLESTCGCSPFSAVGDLIIDDARSAAEAQCVTAVAGDLIVAASAPDLVSLDQLTSIGGRAELHYEIPSSPTGPRNRTIDLSALTTIGGDVDMTTRRGFTQPKSLDTMTNAVTSIGGNVTISTYDNNINAFAGIITMNGDITLQGETGASGNLDIFGGATFPNLTTINGNLTVQGFFACNSVFNSVTTVGQDLTVRAVRLAPSQSFAALTTVSGNLRFESMKAFGPPWPNLTTVGQDVQVVSNGTLISLSNVPIGAVDADGIDLTDNLNLVTLDGSLQAGAGDINVSGNTALSQCDVDTWLDDQTAGGWTGVASVSGTISCP